MTKTATSRARRRSRAEWQDLIKLWQQSGEQQSVFCSRHGLTQASFERWRRLMRADEKRRPLASGFLEVQLAPGSEKPERTSARMGPAVVVQTSLGARIEVFAPEGLSYLNEILGCLGGERC